MTTKQAVVFAILMENNGGIQGKSPDYIREKLYMCSQDDNPECILDQQNYLKLQRWQQLWNQDA